MQDHHTFKDGINFRPKYKWPRKDAKQNCPKCNEPLERVANSKNYYGKPWWCSSCQWQFSQEDLVSLKNNT